MNSTEIIMIFSIIMNFTQAFLFLTLVFLLMRYARREAKRQLNEVLLK